MKKLLIFALICSFLLAGCSKSRNQPESSTTLLVQNDFTLSIQNVLVAYKIGSQTKLYVNLGYFDSNTDKEVNYDQDGTLHIYICYDIVRNGVLYTEMVIAPFTIGKGEKNIISLSALSQVKGISKSSVEYPGSNPSDGQVRICGQYNGKQLYRGPDGGCYYINSNGNKTYVGRTECNC